MPIDHLRYPGSSIQGPWVPHSVQRHQKPWKCYCDRGVKCKSVHCSHLIPVTVSSSYIPNYGRNGDWANITNIRELLDYISNLVEQKHAKPADDLISKLVVEQVRTLAAIPLFPFWTAPANHLSFRLSGHSRTHHEIGCRPDRLPDARCR